MSKSRPYEIIYEDDDIIVINKASQILSIPDRHRPEIINIYTLLSEKYPEIYIVHRIDKDTSGVMIFAKNAEAHKDLNNQFENRTTTKKYIAILRGIPFPEQGRIEAKIGPHPTQLGLMTVSSRGKEAITDYKVLEAFKDFSLVECTILTGRTHQIRVHTKYIGCPIAVDPQYGTHSSLFLSEFKKRKFKIGKFNEEIPMLSRVPLHAFQLTIKHPRTGQEMTFEANPPKDIQAVLSQLRKWS